MEREAMLATDAIHTRLRELALEIEWLSYPPAVPGTTQALALLVVDVQGLLGELVRRVGEDEVEQAIVARHDAIEHAPWRTR